MSAAGIVIGIVLSTYAGRVAAGDGNPFDFFGYFTNQTNTLAAVILFASGYRMLRRRSQPAWLSTLRALAAAYLVVVAVIYNGLVPGTGTAPAWVSAILHIWFPAFVVLDWLFVGDRIALRWRALWIVLPYPFLWLGVVLARGVTDGWVPYGFLLPERGVASLLVHVAALIVTLLAAAAVIWAASRFPPAIRPAENVRHNQDSTDVFDSA